MQTNLTPLPLPLLQNQLRAILVNTGFPEDALCPQVFEYNGPDFKLDVVSELLSV